MQITKTVSIDTGHRVVGHTGKCRNLHGHTYTIEVVLSGTELTGPGFILDFGIISTIIKEWDHKLLLWDQEDEALQLLDAEQYGILYVPFNPTSENMAKYLAERFYEEENVLYASVTVSETESSSANCEVGIPA